MGYFSIFFRGTFSRTMLASCHVKVDLVTAVRSLWKFNESCSVFFYSREVATKGKEGGNRAMAYLIFAGNHRI